MLNENNNSTPLQDEESINIREILAKYLYHWPVFVLGLLICLTSTFLYLRYTPLTYQAKSVLLIKDEKKGGGKPGGDLLNELDIFGTSKVVDNEIEILKSKTLMRRVVSRLNLMIDYTVEGRIIESDIYAVKPVNIGVAELDSTYYGKTLELSFPNSNTYLLEEATTGKRVKGLLDSLQRTAFGIFKVAKNDNFVKWQQKNANTQIFLTLHDPQVIADAYIRNLTVALASKQSSVLNLSLETNVAQKGKEILNTLVQVYNEAGLADKNRTTQSTMDFIDVRSKLISGELTEVEKDVESFKSDRGITTMSNDATLFLDNVKANDARLSEINLQLSVINDIKRYVNSSSSKENLPSTLGINDPVLLQQITKLSELQLQRDEALARTGENNPRLDPLNSQIKTTREGILSSVDNLYQSVNNTKRTLQGNENAIQSNIRKMPGQERQLMSIERQKNTKESIYLYLLQKKEEAALSYASAVADSRIVDPAFSTGLPIKPKKEIILLTAFLLGILLPIGYVYSKELLNNKVDSTNDINKLSHVPVLGEVLFEEGTEAIVVQANSRKAIAEQFRAIRTNMAFLHGKGTPGQGKVTLFTSSMSGEGKSFVASNIAAAHAIAGKKTILLELDLRKPKVSKYLNLNNRTGLSNYLIGKATIADIIQPTQVDPNFYVIGSGPIPPNPSELLIQAEMEELLTYLRANFDEIVIDTPPIGLVTDAQILARLADATIYLVRHGVTFKQQISNLEDLYQQHKFPKLNVILNGIKLGGSYGYGYGYGYGYYSDDHTRKKTSVKQMGKNFFSRF